MNILHESVNLGPQFFTMDYRTLTEPDRVVDFFERWDLPDESFDEVYALLPCHVFLNREADCPICPTELVQRPREKADMQDDFILSEVVRILKPGGRFFFSALTSKFLHEFPIIRNTMFPTMCALNNYQQARRTLIAYADINKEVWLDLAKKENIRIADFLELNQLLALSPPEIVKAFQAHCSLPSDRRATIRKKEAEFLRHCNIHPLMYKKHTKRLPGHMKELFMEELIKLEKLTMMSFEATDKQILLDLFKKYDFNFENKLLPALVQEFVYKALIDKKKPELFMDNIYYYKLDNYDQENIIALYDYWLSKYNLSAEHWNNLLQDRSINIQTPWIRENDMYYFEFQTVYKKIKP